MSKRRTLSPEFKFEAVEQILLRFPFYGYRKLHKALVRQGIAVGEHRVRRLLHLGMNL
jgi:hypothetical protein